MTQFQPPQSDITSNIDLLLAVLPPTIRQALDEGDFPSADLLEIVLDLGRPPEARYRGGEHALSATEITPEDIEYVTNRIGVFGEDNRAGIPRTLHRISAIRNRQGNVIGLTCRVGRAVFGMIAIIRDLIEQGQSLLLLGRPGVGKTTLLRETARVLADELRKRVVIVDTSNEIAGDGDIPHPGIGRARRMQVPHVVEQHAVMIEAVENHMPEVIVIDEIGTEQEAQAARTIAERGVQLIGTAHGNALENLMLNPTLSDLIGGIQAVTLGDEEARYRGTQKTVLERKAPPTFDVLVEIKSWNEMVIYTDVAAAVDALLRGEEVVVEVRQVEANGVVQRELTHVTEARGRESRDGRQRRSARDRRSREGRDPVGRQERALADSNGRRPRRSRSPEAGPAAQPDAAPAADEEPDAGVAESPIARIQRQLRERVQSRTQRIFPLNISRNRLQQAIARLHVPATIVEDIADATLVLTLRTSYRQNPQLLHAAEDAGVPVYVLRANALEPIEERLADIFGLLPGEDG